MTGIDALLGPDAFTSDGECRARKPAPVVIGCPTHTHICREAVDDEARHPTAHECTCGFQW